MKLYSPILLLLLLMFSCKEDIADHSVQKQDSIRIYFQQLVRDTSVTRKKQYADRAVHLANASQNDSMKYMALLYKLDYVITPFHPDSTSFYLDRLSAAAHKSRSKLNAAYALNRNAEYHFTRQSFQKAFDYYDNSRKIFEKENDSLNTVYNLLRMAGIQQFYNDYDGSEQVLTDALVYLENMAIPDKGYLSDAYIKLGIAYMAMNESAQAIAYYQKAKSFTDGAFPKAMIDNNIALAYQKGNHNERAIKLFSELLQSGVLQNDPASIAIITDNLGYAQFMTDGISGLPLMEEALKSRLNRNDSKGLAYSYLHLAEFHAKNNPALVTGHAQKAYENASHTGAVDQQLKAMELLIQHGSIEKSRAYQKKYFHLNDSINALRLSVKNHFAKMRYDASQTKEELLNSRIEAEKDRNAIISIAAVSAFILLTVIFMYILSRFINKRKIQQQSYITEIRIAKKLHDELANDVFNTMAFAEVKDLSTLENKELLLNNLDQIYEQARNISKENSNIVTGAGFSTALREMLSAYANDKVAILINGLEAIDWLQLQRDRKIVIYRVLQELLVNMKKHSQCSLVVITFERTPKKIQIVYSDNGVGMGPEGISSKNGLQNVENRILGINGTIIFDAVARKGFKVSFSFKP